MYTRFFNWDNATNSLAVFGKTLYFCFLAFKTEKMTIHVWNKNLFLLKILFSGRLGLVFEDTGRAVFSVEAEELCGVIVTLVSRISHALLL